MKTLITKLAGSVNNEDLPKVGELRLKVSSIVNPTNETQYSLFNFGSNKTISLTKDGHFTNAALTANQGNSLEFNANSNLGFYLSNGNYDIIIGNKYDVNTIISRAAAINIDDIKYCKQLSTLSAETLGGDLSSLSELKSLTSITLLGKNITGNLSSLSGLTNLLSINITANAEGDLSSFANMTKLTELYLKGIKVTGDASLLPSSVSFIQNKNTSSRMHWKSTRPSSAQIIGFGTDSYMDNVDEMLINQANCKAYEGNIAWYKVINIKGTRTETSNDAVATLQSKGYTIIVRP